MPIFNVIVEEGQLKSSTDFKQKEPEAYASLYQENAGRKTKDKGITTANGRYGGDRLQAFRFSGGTSF